MFFAGSADDNLSKYAFLRNCLSQQVLPLLLDDVMTSIGSLRKFFCLIKFLFCHPFWVQILSLQTQVEYQCPD